MIQVCSPSLVENSRGRLTFFCRHPAFQLVMYQSEGDTVGILRTHGKKRVTSSLEPLAKTRHHLSLILWLGLSLTRRSTAPPSPLSPPPHPRSPIPHLSHFLPASCSSVYLLCNTAALLLLLILLHRHTIRPPPHPIGKPPATASPQACPRH